MTMSIEAYAGNTIKDHEPVTIGGPAYVDAMFGELGNQWTAVLMQQAAAFTTEMVDDMATTAGNAGKLYEDDKVQAAQAYVELGSLMLDSKTAPEEIRAKQSEAGETLDRLHQAQTDGLNSFRKANRAAAALAAASVTEGIKTSQRDKKIATLVCAAETSLQPRLDGVRTLNDASRLQRRGFPRISPDVLRANSLRENEDY